MRISSAAIMGGNYQNYTFFNFQQFSNDDICHIINIYIYLTKYLNKEQLQLHNFYILDKGLKGIH